MPVTSGCSVSLSGRCIRSVKNRGQVSAATKFSRRSNFPFSRPIHLSLTCVLQQIDKNGERLRDPEAAPASVCSLLQRCWLGNPAERPRFADISLELSKSTPLMVRCRTDDKSETPSWDEPAGAKKMDISSGDSIAVISGRFI